VYAEKVFILAINKFKQTDYIVLVERFVYFRLVFNILMMRGGGEGGGPNPTGRPPVELIK